MGYKEIPAVFVDVPTQFPELKEFALTWDNVEVLMPLISFMQVCEHYGFPLISKEVSEIIQGSRKYMKKFRASNDGDMVKTHAKYMSSLIGIRGTSDNTTECAKKLEGLMLDQKKDLQRKINSKQGISQALLNLGKQYAQNNQDLSRFNNSKYSFMLDAPFEVSPACCRVMKKTPIHKYEKMTGRKPITAQMASESRLRAQKWLRNGCNGFDMKRPISNPMSFWTEQDILQYIKENHLQICSVYGEIVEDTSGTDEVTGQMTISDINGFENMKLFDAERPPLKTTGCKRTGCMLCGFGCHMSDDTRFLQLKESHPKMYELLDVVKNNGISFREAINWMNEHGDLNIRL